MTSECSGAVYSKYMHEYDRQRHSLRGRNLLRRRTHYPQQTDETVSAKCNLIKVSFAGLTYFMPLSLNHEGLAALRL
jgi:hypothetical protein